MEFSIDYNALQKLSQEQKHNFKATKPFPHIAMDNFLSKESYEIVKQCLPPMEQDKTWKLRDTPHTRGKYVTKRKDTDCKEIVFGELGRLVLSQFNSSLFLQFLANLSGIPDLIGDPYYVEAGYHAVASGGFLHAHADFSHHRILGLERRLNFFIYLNDDWKPEYGGGLSLYDPQGNEVQSYLPIGNRAIVFQASNIAFHGHPKPLMCPEGMMRKSLALYYYSKPTGRKEEKIQFLDVEGQG